MHWCNEAETLSSRAWNASKKLAIIFQILSAHTQRLLTNPELGILLREWFISFSSSMYLLHCSLCDLCIEFSSLSRIKSCRALPIGEKKLCLASAVEKRQVGEDTLRKRQFFEGFFRQVPQQKSLWSPLLKFSRTFKVTDVKLPLP